MNLAALQERRRRKALVAATIFQAESGGNALGMRQGDPMVTMPWLLAGNYRIRSAGSLQKQPVGEGQLVPARSLKASALAARDIRLWRQRRRCLAAHGQSAVLASSHRDSSLKLDTASIPSHAPSDLNRASVAGGGTPPSATASQRSTFNYSSSTLLQQLEHPGSAAVAAASSQWSSAAELMAMYSKLQSEVTAAPPLQAPPAAHCQLRDIAQAIRESSRFVYSQPQQEKADRFLRLRNELGGLDLMMNPANRNSFGIGDVLQEYNTSELSVADWEECKAVYKDLTIRERAKLTWRDTVCSYLVSEQEIRRHTSSLEALPQAWQHLVRSGKPRAVAAAVAGVKALRLTIKGKRPWASTTSSNIRQDPYRLSVSHLEPLACAGVYAVTQLLMETCPKDGSVNPHELYDILLYIRPPTAQQCVFGKVLSRQATIARPMPVLHHSLEHLFHVASRYNFNRETVYTPARIVRQDIITSAILNARPILGPYDIPLPNCAAVTQLRQVPSPSPPVSSPPRASSPPISPPLVPAAAAVAADDPLDSERHARRGAKVLARLSTGRRRFTGSSSSSSSSSSSTKRSSSSGSESDNDSGILQRVSRDFPNRVGHGVSSNKSNNSSSGSSSDVDSDSDISTATTVRLDYPRMYGAVTAASPSPSPSPSRCRWSMEDSLEDVESGPVVGSGGGSGGGGLESSKIHKMKKLAVAVAEDTRREVWWLSVLDVVDPDFSQAMVSDLTSGEQPAATVRHDQLQQLPLALQPEQPGLACRLMMLAKRAANSVLIASYDDVLGLDGGTALLPRKLLHSLEGEVPSNGIVDEHFTSERPAESEMMVLEEEVRSLSLRERNRIEQLSTAFHVALASDVRLAKLIRVVLTWHRRAVVSSRGGGGGGGGGMPYAMERENNGDVESDISDVSDDLERMPVAAAAAAASTLPVKKILDTLAWLRPGLLESVHRESWGQLAEGAQRHGGCQDPRYGMAEKALRLGLLGLILLAHRPDLPLRQLGLMPCVAAGATYKAWITRSEHPPSVKKGSFTLPDPVAHYHALTAFTAFNFLPGRLHMGRGQAAAAAAAAGAVNARSDAASNVRAPTSSSSQAEMATAEAAIDKANAAKVFGKVFAQGSAVCAAIGLYVSVQVLADEEGLEQPWLFASAPTAAASADATTVGGGAAGSDVKASGADAHGSVGAAEALHRPRRDDGRGVDSLLQELKRDLVVVAARDAHEGAFTASDHDSDSDSDSDSGVMGQSVMSPPPHGGRFDDNSSNDERVDVSLTIPNPTGSSHGGSKPSCHRVAAAGNGTECADPWFTRVSSGGGTGPSWMRGCNLAEAFRPGSDSEDERWFPFPDIKKKEAEEENAEASFSCSSSSSSSSSSRSLSASASASATAIPRGTRSQLQPLPRPQPESRTLPPPPLSFQPPPIPPLSQLEALLWQLRGHHDARPLQSSGMSGGLGNFWDDSGAGGGNGSGSGGGSGGGNGSGGGSGSGGGRADPGMSRYHGRWALDNADRIDKEFDDFLTAMIANEMQPEALALFSEEALLNQVLRDISPHVPGAKDAMKDAETPHSAAKIVTSKATSTSTAAAFASTHTSTAAPLATSTATETARGGTLLEGRDLMPPPPPPPPAASSRSLPQPPQPQSSSSLFPNGGSAAQCLNSQFVVGRKSGGYGAAGAASSSRRKQLGGPNSNPRQSLAHMMRVWRCAAGRSGSGGGGGGRGGGGCGGGSGGDTAPSTSSSSTEYITTVGGPGMALALTALYCGDRVRSSGRGSGTESGFGSIPRLGDGSNLSEPARSTSTSALRSSVPAAISSARAATEGSRGGGFLHSCFQPIASAKSAQMALGGQLGQRAAQQDVFPPPDGVPGVALLSVRSAAVSEELLEMAAAAAAGPDGRPAGGGGSSKRTVAGMTPGSELLLVSARHAFKTAAAIARNSLVLGRSGSLRVHAMGVEGLETAIMLLAQIRVEMMKQNRDLVVVLRQLDHQGIAAGADADDGDNSTAVAAASGPPKEPASRASGAYADEDDESLVSRGNSNDGDSGGGGGGGGKTTADPVLKLLKEYDDCILAFKNFLPALNLGLQDRRTKPDLDLEQQLDELVSECDAAAAARQRNGAGDAHNDALASANPSGMFSEFRFRTRSGLGSGLPDPKDGLLVRKLCDCIRTLESLMVGHSAVRKGLVADLLVYECELNKPDRLVLQRSGDCDNGSGKAGPANTAGGKASAASVVKRRGKWAPSVANGTSAAAAAALLSAAAAAEEGLIKSILAIEKELERIESGDGG